ncbi:MAG: hypothetical protein VYD87_21005 [Pseudomonadota bacterium]|nr:hypothetical protein [Pseudomonadota bacterium]
MSFINTRLAGALIGAGAALLALPAAGSTLVATWSAITWHNETKVMPSLILRFANDEVDAAYFTPEDLVDYTFTGFEGYGSDSQVAAYGHFDASYLIGAVELFSPPNYAGVPNHVGADGSMGEGWRISFYMPAATTASGYDETVLSATRDAYAAPRFSVRAYWSGDPRYCTECALRLYKDSAVYDGEATSFAEAPEAAVPLPGALGLLGGALAGLAGLGARRRKG